jgi:hypothetical protein
MITLNEIRKNQSELKTTICQSIAEFMENHNCTELDVTDFDSTPVIMEDLERSDYSWTMDRLTYDGNGNVRVHCSNCEDCESFYTTTLKTDVLIDVYEWLIDNEEWLDFDEEE